MDTNAGKWINVMVGAGTFLLTACFLDEIKLCHQVREMMKNGSGKATERLRK